MLQFFESAFPDHIEDLLISFQLLLEGRKIGVLLSSLDFVLFLLTMCLFVKSANWFGGRLSCCQILANCFLRLPESINFEFPPKFSLLFSGRFSFLLPSLDLFLGFLGLNSLLFLLGHSLFVNKFLHCWYNIN